MEIHWRNIQFVETAVALRKIPKKKTQFSLYITCGTYPKTTTRFHHPHSACFSSMTFTKCQSIAPPYAVRCMHTIQAAERIHTQLLVSLSIRFPPTRPECGNAAATVPLAPISFHIWQTQTKSSRAVRTYTTHSIHTPLVVPKRTDNYNTKWRETAIMPILSINASNSYNLYCNSLDTVKVVFVVLVVGNS